jgi:competence protein ComEA
MFERGAVLAVEWADRFMETLGPDRLEIELEGPSAMDEGAGSESGPARARAGSARAFGPEAERVLSDWATRVARFERGRGSTEDSAPGGLRAGGTPEMWIPAVCLLALGIAGFAGLERPAADSPCVAPSPVTEDALGVDRVTCGIAGGVWPEHAGVGGLLFGQRIDLNSVSVERLEALPEIGPARARAIVAHRRESRFGSVAELERVHGIGPKIRARLESWLRVAPARAEASDAPLLPGAPARDSSRPRARAMRHG